jgi:hypothetical protein
MAGPRLALALVAAFALSAPSLAQQQTQVTFPRGQSSATLKGSIKGDQYRDYLVNARAGQTMNVTLTNPDGRAFFNVLPPGSTGEAVFIGSTSGNSFSGPVPGTGNTTIRVYQMRATGRRGEVASYTLTIGVTGSAPRASTDAMVPGTKYNATATVSCVPGPDAPPGGCQAGVIRKGGGNAVVEMQTPDGGQRSIIFTGGKATGSNASGATLTATRNGDITIVRLSTGEVYSIPDALVFGG